MPRKAGKLTLIIFLLLISSCNNKLKESSSSSSSSSISSISSESSSSSTISNSSLTQVSTIPIIEGVKDLTINYGDAFNPLAGVKAKSIFGQDITSKLVVEGLDKLTITNGKVYSLGNYVLRYYLEDNNLQAQEYMILSVNYNDDLTSIVKNGDFKHDSILWEFNNAESSVTDSKLVIKSVNSEKLVNVYQNNLKLQGNKVYTVSFVAQASKELELQVDLFSGNTNIKPGFDTKFSVKTTSNVYSFSFITSNMDIDNGMIKFTSLILNNESIALSSISIIKENVISDIVAPTISGTKDWHVLLGTKINPLTGVTAFDDVDGNITYKLNYEIPYGAIIGSNLVTFTQVGSFPIIYRVSDEAGNKAEVMRTITVTEGVEPNVNLLVNGDFSGPISLNYVDNNEGSEATFEIIDNTLVVSMISLPSKVTSPFPRVIFGKVINTSFTEGLVFEQNATYDLKFRLKAGVNRSFVVQIGELYASDPWINRFTEEIVVNATTEYTEFTYTFTMKQATNANGMISFCFGVTNRPDAVATTFYLQNVSLIKKG
jgi:hypothetical protein